MNVAKRVTAGAEWSFRKSFNDRIDGLENPSGVHSVIHNNDWYSFMGIFITYKFFNFAGDCPAYKKEKWISHIELIFIHIDNMMKYIIKTNKI